MSYYNGSIMKILTFISKNNLFNLLIHMYLFLYLIYQSLKIILIIKRNIFFVGCKKKSVDLRLYDSFLARAVDWRPRLRFLQTFFRLFSQTNRPWPWAFGCLTPPTANYFKRTIPNSHPLTFPIVSVHAN